MKPVDLRSKLVAVAQKYGGRRSSRWTRCRDIVRWRRDYCLVAESAIDAAFVSWVALASGLSIGPKKGKGDASCWIAWLRSERRTVAWDQAAAGDLFWSISNCGEPCIGIVLSPIRTSNSCEPTFEAIWGASRVGEGGVVDEVVFKSLKLLPGHRFARLIS